MKYLRDIAAPGDQYVVELDLGKSGKLIPVAAVNPRDAYGLAVLERFGPKPAHRPGGVVYRLDPEGEPIGK